MSDAQLAREVMTAGRRPVTRPLASALNWTVVYSGSCCRKTRKWRKNLRANLTIWSVTNPGFSMSCQVRLYPPGHRGISAPIPPGWLMTRKALSDDWLGSITYPRVPRFIFSPYFIQRHPDLWEASAPLRSRSDLSKSRERRATPA